MKKKPCAHCRAQRGLKLSECPDGDWCVMCHTCWATGPSASSRAQAERYWNERDSDFRLKEIAEYTAYLKSRRHAE